MSIETIEFSTNPQPSPYAVLLAALKVSIKQDAIDIRAQKAEIKQLQKSFGPGGAASLQSRLCYQRLEARARLLVYGLMRGRTREQIEPKHADDSNYLKFAIQRVFKVAQDATLKQTGVSVPLPEPIQELVR